MATEVSIIAIPIKMILIWIYKQKKRNDGASVFSENNS
jgi:hypothetical protein